MLPGDMVGAYCAGLLRPALCAMFAVERDLSGTPRIVGVTGATRTVDRYGMALSTEWSIAGGVRGERPRTSAERLRFVGARRGRLSATVCHREKLNSCRLSTPSAV